MLEKGLGLVLCDRVGSGGAVVGSMSVDMVPPLVPWEYFPWHPLMGRVISTYWRLVHGGYSAN